MKLKMKVWSIALVLISQCASANWLNSDNTDAITEGRTISVFSYKYKQDETIGLRCDVSAEGEEALITFDADSVLGVPNTQVDMFVKVDDNKPIKFRGRLYSNSYTSGFVRANDKTESQFNKLVAQMTSGNKAIVKIQNDRRSEIVNFNVSLSGFTAKSKKVLSVCKLNSKAIEISAEDKVRLKEINIELEKLGSEKDSILSKY
ncbi:invasion associated locus B family protein [Vibrio algicola]|uniref:Uncharacterized protein n=1 Tax=Vibrio algicola TaxID=2662262 RepID=A0A5Q0TKZ9_9VIBR|nr:hypothetical protein [Vibrio algicola]